VATTAAHSPGEKTSIFLLATIVLVCVVGGAFAAGWLIGTILS
jgi:hypothetical protein